MLYFYDYHTPFCVSLRHYLLFSSINYYLFLFLTDGTTLKSFNLAKKHQKFTIALLGDSMLLDAIQNYNLIGKLQQFLPMYNFNVSVHANSAVRIKNIRERLPRFISKLTGARCVRMHLIEIDSSNCSSCYRHQDSRFQFLIECRLPLNFLFLKRSSKVTKYRGNKG